MYIGANKCEQNRQIILKRSHVRTYIHHSLLIQSRFPPPLLSSLPPFTPPKYTPLMETIHRTRKRERNYENIVECVWRWFLCFRNWCYKYTAMYAEMLFLLAFVGTTEMARPTNYPCFPLKITIRCEVLIRSLVGSFKRLRWEVFVSRRRWLQEPMV